MMFKRYLLHENLWVRFGSLLGMVLLVLFGAWMLSYLFLPEGILRGRTAAHALAGDDLLGGSIWLEWLRILAINMAVMFLMMIAPNVIQNENGYPFGYTTAILTALIFGVVLGTDSFSISQGGKLAPTLAIFGRSGVYEISAYALAAAATVSISKYRLVGKWPRQTVEKITPQAAQSMIQERTLGVLLAVALLAAACGWESYRIAQALGFA